MLINLQCMLSKIPFYRNAQAVLYMENDVCSRIYVTKSKPHISRYSPEDCTIVFLNNTRQQIGNLCISNVVLCQSKGITN